MRKNYFKLIIIFAFILFISFLSRIYSADNLNTYSASAIAVDADSGLVLYGKNIDKKIYPASTTKIITAILAIENLDLNKEITVSDTAVLLPPESSSIYLKAGEKITVKDLLYGLLLNSRK